MEFGFFNKKEFGVPAGVRYLTLNDCYFVDAIPRVLGTRHPISRRRLFVPVLDQRRSLLNSG